jgi:thioester reductase-like protein
MKNIFITGTTGFLGSYFLYHVLQYSEDNIICLARDNSKFSAKDRVLQQLNKIHKSFYSAGIHDTNIKTKIKKRLQVLSGDITQKNLGLKMDIEKSAIHEFWHIAANVQFCETEKDEIINVNVEGGRNVLQFVKDNEIPVFNYISTAYVAGKKSGRVDETPDFNLFPANNVYEESKRLMEKEILAANKNGEFSFRIFRPAIIVGHSKTYEPDPSNGGLYGFLSLSNSLKKRFEISHPEYFKQNEIRLLINEDHSLSLVAVDHVVDILFKTGSCTNSLNKIYHVTSDNETSLREVASLVNQFTNLNFRFESTNENFQSIDYLFERKINRYSCYLSYKKRFEKSNIHIAGINNCKYHLDSEILSQLIESFYIKAGQRMQEKIPHNNDFAK